ncbi:transmembrane protein 150C isoform 1-T2 [Polymixia lowei]
MRMCNLWILVPLMYTVFTIIGLWVVYFIAVADNKIVPLSSEYSYNGTRRPPYISIAGNDPPASCIFSQVMNLAAFLGFIIGVLRYLHLKPRVPWLNKGSLLALSLACFGMTLVGNFQVFFVRSIHDIGTYMTFGLGTLFCWVQSVITLKANLRNEGKKAGILRLLLSASITVCMILYFTLISQRLHMHAARTQWVLVMFFLGFFSTFAIEFRHCHFELVCTSDPEPALSPSQTFSRVSEPQPDHIS